eukprot:RCo016395
MDTAGLQALEFVKVVSLNGFQLNFVLTSCPDEKFSVVLPEGRRLAAHPERLGGWERDLGGLTRAVECLALNWSLRPVHILTPTSATPLVPGPHAHPTCRLMADLFTQGKLCASIAPEPPLKPAVVPLVFSFLATFSRVPFWPCSHVVRDYFYCYFIKCS